MRRWLWAFTCAILGCFGEADTDVDVDAGESSGRESGEGATTDASGTSTTTVGSGSGTASTTSDPDTSSTSDASSETSDATSSADESSTTGGTATWCASQRGDVLLCHDFDDDVPFLGANLWQDHGTVEVSDEQSTSPPSSMRVEVTPNATEPSNASLGQQIVGASLPFAGVLAVRMWIAPECFAGAGGSVQRLALALQFFDARDPDGPFLLNTTIWFSQDDTYYYESDQPQGYPSTEHPLGVALAPDMWHEITLDHDAAGDLVTIGIDGALQNVQLALATDGVIDQISDIVPAIAVGTAMAPNQPGCTMYFDDVIVTE
jgi:hypothetical protein